MSITYFKSSLYYTQCFFNFVFFMTQPFFLFHFDIQASQHLFTDPNEIANHLTLRKEVFEKLQFPETPMEEGS